VNYRFYSLDTPIQNSTPIIFMRTFLVSRGVHTRRIRVNIAPKRRGSAEQHLRTQYPKEVKIYRNKCNHLKIALAVMIDSDMRRVADRLDELDSSLTNFALSEWNLQQWIKDRGGQDKYIKLTRQIMSFYVISNRCVENLF